MNPPIMQRVLPEVQRRTLSELSDDLDLRAGDAASKRSAFWTMLVVSAVIAAAGVLSDSTATVIGAMIIAPLSTPIMGMALGVVRRDGGLARYALKYALLGAALVILIGVAFAVMLPGQVNLITNSQISGRTSPGLLDLLAAVATGVAGSVALTRRDVAAVLPGVAIAISLVPPLVVVGVCAGQGAFTLALGALVLFTSNLVALCLVGTLVFSAAGYWDQDGTGQLSHRRAYTAIGTLLVLVLIPLAVNTVGNIAVAIWTDRVEASAQQWIGKSPGGRVDSVDLASGTFYVRVRVPGALPPVDTLMTSLSGQVPNGMNLVVSTLVGQDSPVQIVGG